MNLIKLYINEVTKRLPQEIKEDVALELQSTIYDNLPEDYSKGEVIDLLEELGNPAILASKYNDSPSYLIGPKFYHDYLAFLRIILPIVAIVTFITVTAMNFIGAVEAGATLETLLFSLGEGIWHIIDALLQTLLWITLAFVIIERSSKRKSLKSLPKKWSIEDLQKLVYIPKKKAIGMFEVTAGLVWTVLWGTAYFYSDYLIGIYEETASGLRMVIPAFESELLFSYWPLAILVIILEVGLAIYKLIKKQWSKTLAIFFTISQIITVLIVSFIISRDGLFTAEFLQRMSEVFSVETISLYNGLVYGVITIFLISAGLGIYDAFKKSAN